MLARRRTQKNFLNLGKSDWMCACESESSLRTWLIFVLVFKAVPDVSGVIEMSGLLLDLSPPKLCG
jgi:hypothetical protein